MTAEEHQAIMEQIQATNAGIEAELRALNAKFDDHHTRIGNLEDEVYGNDDRKIEGLKPQVQLMHDLVERGRGILWLIAFAGISNIVAIFWLMAKTL